MLSGRPETWAFPPPWWPFECGFDAGSCAMTLVDASDSRNTTRPKRATACARTRSELIDRWLVIVRAVLFGWNSCEHQEMIGMRSLPHNASIFGYFNVLNTLAMLRFFSGGRSTSI